MRKETLYSRSSRSKPADSPAAHQGDAPAAPVPKRRPPWMRPQLSWLLALALLAALAVLTLQILRAPVPRALTQADIDKAVMHALEKGTLPSPAAKAYEVIRPSVVRVRGLGRNPHKDLGNTGTSTGSGVVVVDTGLILTSLHVVAGADEIEVTFHNGLKSEAHIVGTQPQNDLAVLQASTLPDDLFAATLRSTQDLAPGEHVIAVGFPFAIGPSVSSGVVSGLKRQYQSPEGNTFLTNLIQFDAAANPGSSGGPLVTSDGEVVGIVTAILNPSEQRVFIGIGFAVPIENAAAAVGLTPF
jgi:S1-C subfamily serine protease